MHSDWDTHEQRISDAILGLTALLAAVALDRPAKATGGGCCKVTECNYTEHRNG